MSGIAERRARLLAAKYEAFGVEATWAGHEEPVRVCLNDRDEVETHGRARIIGQAVTLKVRRSEVASPAVGQVVQIGERLFKVSQEPKVNRLGEWSCGAIEVAP